jgi:hypothetical protein
LHFLHYIAIEADSAQEAFSEVENALEQDSNFASWSDWSVVGGGRWSDSQYENSPNGVISFATDPDKFTKALASVLKNRKDEMNDCLSNMNLDKFTSDIVDFISNGGEPRDGYSMNNYYISIATDLLADHYISGSYFYDLGEPSVDEVWSANTKYLSERLLDPEKAKRQYLVPVDFHS